MIDSACMGKLQMELYVFPVLKTNVYTVQKLKTNAPFAKEAFTVSRVVAKNVIQVEFAALAMKKEFA